MGKKVLVAIRMAGIAGQDKLAGIFRHLSETYGGNAPWDIQLVRTKAEFSAELVGRAIADGTDGFIMSIPDTEDALAPLAATDAPTIVMDVGCGRLEGRSRNIVRIRNSAREISVEAARYLIGQGVARSYAFLHPARRTDWSIDRFSAFREALGESGLWCEEFDDPEQVAKLRRPAAVLAANDDIAFELLKVLRAKRIKVPREVAVLGVDNDVLLCENAFPRLSSVRPDFESEGRVAAETLDAMMGGKSPKSREIVIGVREIVRRESTSEQSHAGSLVQKAVAYIDRHALEGIGVEDVVRHLKCSRRLADLRFRELQGRSILQAITEKRLDEVKRRLMQTREKIDTIATDCGYDSPNYLKSLFRKRFAMTMSTFRRSAATNLR